MLTTEQQKEIQPKLTTQLVIHCALGMGMLSMMAVIAMIVDWKELSTDAGMLPLMAAIAGLMTYGMSFIVPKILSAGNGAIAAGLAKQQGSIEVPADRIIRTLIGNSLNQKIISAALVEGGVFLNLIVFLLEPTTVSLAIIAIGFLIFLFRFPFPGRQLARIESDLDDVQRELSLLRR